ncbi:hypothetical protein M9Y10_016029 [Tritrichomonas musculus]|uniref:Protein kinase domain-containing protein n=1 Tax=Tritrichomonas musculus TaxID=1915356 RepID=A0ABR2I5A0_9EUKA
MENCIDDQNSTTLINHLKANKFIVYYYSISQRSISESNSFFIFCFECQCIFVKQISNKLFNEIISKLIENEKTLIDATQKSQEIDNFCSNFNKVNNFVKLTIRPIAGYLIQRYFYPTDYFNDQSFFIYKGNKKLFNEQKLKKDLSNNLFGDKMREDIQKIVENDKVKENSSENAKQEFKQKDFYFLKEIYQNDNASYHLSIHSKSLYVFVLKKLKYPHLKINRIDREIDFCTNYSHRCLTPFYGFLKEDNKIIGFVYEYMSNGSLEDFYRSYFDKMIPTHFMMIINRIFQGVKYLHSQFLIHRDLKPANILIDHDYLPYISDFETVKKVNENEEATYDFGSYLYSSPEQDSGGNISYYTDIYSLGLLIYYILDNKNPKPKNSNEEKQQIINGSYNLKNIYYRCIEKSQEKRPTIQQIIDLFAIDTTLFYFIEHFFMEDSFIISKIPNVKYTNQSIFVQFIYENILLLQNYSFLLENYITSLLDFQFIYNSFVVSNKSDFLTLIGYLYSLSDPLKSKEFFELAANLCNSEAYFYLGCMYLEGNGVKQDYVRAREYLEKAAESNYPSSFNNLGTFYYLGLGVKQDFEKAKKYFELGSKHNDPNSFINLGKIYLYGRGVPKDYLMAHKCFLQASESQNPIAYNSLGYLYQEGLGVQQDFKEAKKYFEMAAKLFDSEAFIYLGDLYYNGLGVEKDNNVAIKYYKQAGNSAGNVKLGNLFMNDTGNKKDIPAAIYYYELAAKQNNPEALFVLAELYSSGDIVEIDLKKAIEYLIKCVGISKEKRTNYNQIFGIIFMSFNYNEFFYHANNSLGLIYLIYEHNIEKANQYIKEAAFAEYPFGQNNYGLLNQFYLDDKVKANHFFERSSKHNLSLAYYNLGFLKEQNNDLEGAFDNYIKASKYENEPLIFHNKCFDSDKRLEISKTFIICYTNLRLTNYFLLQNNIDEAKNYFGKVLSKLHSNHNNNSQNCFQFCFVKNDPKKFFSVLKKIILCFPLFNLSNQPNLNHHEQMKIENFNLESDNLNKLEPNQISIETNNEIIQKIKIKDNFKENYKNNTSDKSFKSKNIDGIENNKRTPLLDREKLKDDEKVVFRDLSELFYFFISCDEYKNLFIESINKIINIMKSILYTPPYNILFGRINISLLKNRSNNITNGNLPDINESFYEGLAP